MRLAHLRHLVCPHTRRPLVLADGAALDGERVWTGELLEPESGRRYTVVEGIPRFAPRDNYARSFGLEWNLHAVTQYDRESAGPGLSRERFQRETGWEADLAGELILEAGSGSGRFTEHALATGATVVSFDYSEAVAANYRSNGRHPNLLLVQADIFAPPFRRGYFDRCFCFGVLQHTPDPRRAFLVLVDLLKPGGRMASDIYHKGVFRWLLNTKYLVRPFTAGRDPAKLYRAVKAYVDFMWPLARWIRRVPRIGPTLNWRLLVADYAHLLPGAPDDVLRNWAYLDTFDMLSPRYDLPQTVRGFRRWHRQAGLAEIDVRKGFNGVQGRGVKPADPTGP